MAYRKVYFRIQAYAYGYDYSCNSGWSNEADEAAFEQERRSLFQQLGWMLHPGANGAYDTAANDRQDLYLHPTSFSGVMEEANIQPLQERLSKGKTFRCYAVDCCEEYADLSDEEYRAVLEAKREEITAFILEHCRTKRTNLYITDPVAARFGEHIEMYAIGKLNLEAGNASAACRWFEKSAELGNPFAQYQLGKLLLAGEGVRKDIERALHWLTASAEQGNQFAQYALGKLYLLERDIPQDKEAAVRWFTQAAEQGNEYAQYFLDHMNDPQGPPLLTNATRLLHHMSRIFRDEAPPALPGISFVDSKLRRRIREKKIAMGHKPDDHEDQGIAMR